MHRMMGPVENLKESGGQKLVKMKYFTNLLGLNS